MPVKFTSEGISQKYDERSTNSPAKSVRVNAQRTIVLMENAQHAANENFCVIGLEKQVLS